MGGEATPPAGPHQIKIASYGPVMKVECAYNVGETVTAAGFTLQCLNIQRSMHLVMLHMQYLYLDMMTSSLWVFVPLLVTDTTACTLTIIAEEMSLLTTAYTLIIQLCKY